MELDSYGSAPEDKASLAKYHGKLRHYPIYLRVDRVPANRLKLISRSALAFAKQACFPKRKREHSHL